MQKETEKNYGAIGAAGVTNRTVGYSVVVTGLTAGLIYLLIRGKIPAFASDLLIASWLGAITYMSILLYLVLSPNSAEKLGSLFLRILKSFRIQRYREGDSLSPGLMDSLRSFHEGFKFFREHPRYLRIPYTFMTLSYILNFSVYVLVFYALGFNHLILDFFILVYFLAGAIQDATSAFSVGGLEILLTNIFIFFGIAPAASGVAATVLRSVTFWLPLLAGYGIVQIVGAKKLLIPKVREQIQAQQKDNVPAVEQVSSLT